jgi:glycerol-3-phosphate dehydrogenase (NAD+)
MLEHPTSVVVASKFLYHAVTVQRAMSSGLFRCYTSQDLIGVELGGALKNPLAIGAGMIEGQGMGINTMAAYVTRSSLELMQLCKAMGGQPQTISGLSGIGDLMLTAFGDLSRNRTMGLRLTKGESVQDICKSMTVEGVPTAAVAVKFADACGLELPLFRAVAAVLDGSMSIPDVRSSLQSRPVNQETPNLYG